MTKGLLLVLICLGCAFLTQAQVDSSAPAQPVAQKSDTVKPKPKPVIKKKPILPPVPAVDSTVLVDTTKTVIADSIPKGWPYARVMFKVFSSYEAIPFSQAPVQKLMVKRVVENKDWVFYLFVALLLVLGLFRLYFAKYFNDLQRLFFNTTLKQKQIREQMIQAALPSLLFNAYFVVSAGVFAFFLLQYYKLNAATNRWILMSACILLILVIYLVKFITLKLCGWIFDRKEAADTYIFIVFLLNKLLGVFLVPFSIIISYARGSLLDIVVTLSYALIAGFFLYRIFLSYSALRNELKISLLHFFLYLCAFEIIPVILIYKVLLDLLERNL